MKLETNINKEKLLTLLLFFFITVIYFYVSPIHSDVSWAARNIENSKLSLVSLELWASRSDPFLSPLISKWLNRDAFLMVLAQISISIAIWYSFIFTFLRLIKHQITRCLSIIVLTGFALSIDSFAWNWVIQSESLSNSMLVFYLGTIFLYYLNQRQQEHWKYSILILFSSILFCSTRDIGMYFVLLVSLGFLLEWAFLLTKQGKRKMLLVNVVAGALVFFAFQSMTDHQSRWAPTLADSFTYRVLVKPEYRNYFAERGMPLQAGGVSLNSVDLGSTGEVGTYSEAESKSTPMYSYVHSPEFNEWLELNGKKAYAGFLLSRPFDSLSEVFFSTSDLRTIFDEPLGYYLGLHQEENVLPAWYVFLERTLLFPRGASYLFFLSVAAICFIYLFRCRSVPSILKLSALMLIGSVVLSFLLWQVTPMEIQRHTLPIKMMTRLASFMIILVALDRLADRPTRYKH